MKNATGRRFFAGLLAVMMLLSGCRSRGSEKSDGTSPTYQVPEFQDRNSRPKKAAACRQIFPNWSRESWA